jgi:hypothetical protein
MSQVVMKMGYYAYFHYMSQVVMKMGYYAYFHSTMSYGIILWGNSTDSTEIFKIQKRAIRIIIGARIEILADSFKNFKILSFHSQYILSLLLLVVYNKSTYNLNSDIHNKYEAKIQLPPTFSKSFSI